MSGWWRRLFRGQPPSDEPQQLHFRDGEAFFRLECEYKENSIVSGQHLVAIVLDARAEAGTKDAIKINPDGSQLAMIRVASQDGGWRTLATTASGGKAPLHVGDLVAWLPMQQMPQPIGDDPRTAWAGLIIARVAPQWNGETLKVLDRY